MMLDHLSAADEYGPRGFSAAVERARAQYNEMPGLQLTTAQAARLFGLRTDICEEVLLELVRAGFLERRGRAVFARCR